MPLVSIVIPTYNSAKYLPETLDSILSQSFRDIEIIIVDDASTDNTREVIQSVNSDKIRYILLTENHGGPSKPRNVGVRAATGEYISLCDSDDIMLPGKLEKSIQFYKLNVNLGMVFTDFVKFDDVNGVYDKTFLSEYDKFLSIKKRKVCNDCYEINSDSAYETLFFENYIGTSGVVVRKDLLIKSGGFDEDLTNADDIDMWYKITKSYDIGYIDMKGHYYRKREGGVSLRGYTLEENRIKVMRKQLKNELSKLTSRRAHELIAEHLFGIGYYFQQNRKMKDARTYYILCMQEYFNLKALKGVLITFFPRKLFAFLERILKV